MCGSRVEINYDQSMCGRVMMKWRRADGPGIVNLFFVLDLSYRDMSSLKISVPLVTPENGDPIPATPPLNGDEAELVEDTILEPGAQKKKKKKKPKKSATAKARDAAVVTANSKADAKAKEEEAGRPPVLCISRNKHWRYISSYHVCAVFPCVHCK